MRISDWSSDVCSSDLFVAMMPCADESALWRTRKYPGQRSGAAKRASSGWSAAAAAASRTAAAQAASSVAAVERKSVVEGKSVSVRVDLGGRRIFQKNITKNYNTLNT